VNKLNNLQYIFIFLIPKTHRGPQKRPRGLPVARMFETPDLNRNRNILQRFSDPDNFYLIKIADWL